MARFLAGMLIATAALVAILAMNTPHDGRAPAWETAQLAIDANGAVRLSEAAQNYQLRIAEIDAQRAQVQAQEATIRAAVVATALVIALFLIVAGVVLVRRPAQVIHVHQLTGGAHPQIDEPPAEVVTIPYRNRIEVHQ